MRRFLILLMLAAMSVPSMAQDIAPTTPSNFINILLGAMATLITVVVVPLAIIWGQGLIAERRLKNAQLAAQLSATLDSGAQKAIGGALGAIDIPDGKLSGDAKNRVVVLASQALVRNFPETFTALGIEDHAVTAKAKEMVESRLGMMDAQSAGNPVPNPSQPLAAPSTQNVTVTPNKK